MVAVARIKQTITTVDAIAASIASSVEQQCAATAEIARNVVATAAAANEMTARTAEVLDEARGTSRHAADVRENAIGLNRAIEELRHAVIRVIRTSTAEVDRRTKQRYDVDLPSRLTVAGRVYDARVTNLSESGLSAGGIYARGGPALRARIQGTIDIDRVGLRLTFIVKLSERDLLHLELTPDDATAARFNGVPEQLAQRRAA